MDLYFCPSLGFQYLGLQVPKLPHQLAFHSYLSYDVRDACDVRYLRSQLEQHNHILILDSCFRSSRMDRQFLAKVISQHWRLRNLGHPRQFASQRCLSWHYGGGYGVYVTRKLQVPQGQHIRNHFLDSCFRSSRMDLCFYSS
jgi:hypothetical protein